MIGDLKIYLDTDLLRSNYDRLRYNTVSQGNNFLYADITNKIIKCFYAVYNRLGHGFLEKVYENALLMELHEIGLDCLKQHPIEVKYKERLVGMYFADILVNNCVVIEVKAAETIAPAHEAQLVNYLKGTDLEVGILLNFGKDPQFKRKVLTAPFKNHNKS